MNAIQKNQAFYTVTPDAPILQREFGYYCMDKWIREGHLTKETDMNKLFMFDDNPVYTLSALGGCEAEFYPKFEEIILEDRGEHELVQDTAGRGVLYFKGRRNGFMPEYVTHPVTDMRSWEEKCLWRMDPDSEGRLEKLKKNISGAQEAAVQGKLIRQYMVGGYMYLRSLMGPEGVLYMFYDDPDLIHECMKAWLRLADRVTAWYQQYTDIDELQLDEDICYKVGALISPDMIREFLFPYYQQLFENVARRNVRGSFYHAPGTVLGQLATDGNFSGVLEMYKEIGFNFFAPVEVAADMDVVALRKKYPDILLSGGFDKRILAAGKDAIDREIDRIMPFMKKAGGYYPTCDHGVPEEVKFDDYLYFRKRMTEFG